MSESVFNEPLLEPDEIMLISELGPVYSIYKTIKSEIGRFKDEIQPTWKFYGKKNGWLLKLMSGKKNVLFVIPQNKSFRISFTFGDSVFQEIMSSSISEKLKNEFSKANKYAEGRTIQLTVENEEILKDIMTLIHIKMK